MGSGQNVDRLSNMPEEVISHILSLMPTNFAVETCVLSKKWIHSWKSVTNLDFDDEHYFLDERCFTEFVDSVLECCTASQVKIFRLHCSELRVDQWRVCKWIDAAVRLNVCELDVKVESFVLPHSLFTCKTLTNFSLSDIGHYFYDSDKKHSELNYPSYVNLPCLKTMVIDMDHLKEASVNAFNLIHGCPVLQSLSLIMFGHSNEDYNFNIPTLKHMKLSIKEGTSRNYKVVLNVPKLEDLYVITEMSQVFVMENLSSLISVTLSTYNGCRPIWVEFLKGVSGAKSLTLRMTCYLKKPSNTPMPNFPYLKHLEVDARTYWKSLDWPFIHQILENSPGLEHLCIIKSPNDQTDNGWIEPQSVPTCMLNNLRTMKFAIFGRQKSYLQILAYLLGNAKVLTMLTIKFGSHLPLEEKMQLSAELLKIPRASTYCQIHFLGSRSRSTTGGNKQTTKPRTWIELEHAR